jgi:hypothetical protein
MRTKLLLLLSAVLFIATTEAVAQNPIKKITITVTDVLTGKPVENADVSFKGLIFKQKKKTGADGKAVAEIYLASDAQKIDINIIDTVPGAGHKAHQTSVTLMKGQDVYDLSAQLKPAFKKISITVVDEKNQPVSYAAVTIKGNPDQTINATANGTAIFIVPYPEPNTVTSLTIKREGYEDFKTNIDAYSQNSEVPLVTALKKSSSNVSSSYDVAKPPAMLDPTSNVNTGIMDSRNSNEKGETTTTLPFTPICNNDPLSVVPSFNSYFVEDEKTVSAYIAQSCLGFTWDAVNSLTEFVFNPPEFNLNDTNRLKNLKASKDVFDKLKAFYDRVNKIPKDPIDFTVTCAYGGLEKYAIASAPELLQPAKNVKTSYDDYQQSKKDITDKLNAIQGKIDKNEEVNYLAELKSINVMQAFTKMKNLYGTLTSTYSLLSTLLLDSEKLLPYDQQASNLLARLKAKMDNIQSNCQLAEANQLIQQAILAAQLGLGGARKSQAQAQKKVLRLNDEINVIMQKYPSIKNWQTTGESYGVEGLPDEVKGQYKEWAAANKQLYEQTLRTTTLTSQLQTIVAECSHLEQVAGALNKIAGRYNETYSEGMQKISNCKLDEAESKVTELLMIETADCGKLLNKSGSEPLSKRLNKLISDIKSTNACESKEQKNPKEIDAGVFIVTSKDWLSTGVAVQKGDGVRVVAEGEFVSQSDPKFKFGPGGGGYWVWWVLKTKVGKQMQDVGTKGSMYIQEDGSLELGAPRVGRFFESDAMDLGGFFRVHVFIQPGSPRKNPVVEKTPAATTGAGDIKVKEVSEKNFEKTTGIPSSYGIFKLIENGIKPTGTAVLGKFPDYIDKAKELNASVFSLGDKFEELMRDGYDPWKANVYYLDRIADMKQKILIELGGKKLEGYLEKEVKYLLEKRGYKWGDGGKTLVPPK